MVTVDAPRGGNRERDLRSGFEIPAGLGVPSVAAALGVDAGGDDRGDLRADGPRCLGWRTSKGWPEVPSLPVLVKGVLTAEDAALAVEHGAAGVVVSNHGGRQLDCALATADACRRSSRQSTVGRGLVEAVSAAAPTWRSRWRSGPTP